MQTLPKAPVEDWLQALSEDDRIRLARFVSTSGAGDVTKVGLQAANFWVDALGRSKARGTPGQLRPQEGWLDAESEHVQQFQSALKEVLKNGSDLGEGDDLKVWLRGISEQVAHKLSQDAQHLLFPTAAAIIQIQAMGLDEWLQD